MGEEWGVSLMVLFHGGKGWEGVGPIRQLPQIAEIHLMPTRSPSLMVDDSVPGPSLTTLPTPSWPPIWPAEVG